jgi:hypothetical protein
VPDYTVKAVTDVLYLRIKRTTYLRALKASGMSKKPSPGDLVSILLNFFFYLFGWVETNPSNIWQHPYLTSAKAVSVVP